MSDVRDLWDEYFGSKSEEQVDDSIKCVCDLNRMMLEGCKCGAMEEERRRLEEQIEAYIKANNKDLKDGVPYEERNRRYGKYIKVV